MSSVKIAIEIENKPLAIMNFLTKVKLYDGQEIYEQHIDPTPENIEAEIQRAFGNNYISWQIIDETNIPTDRKYRNAWVVSGNSVVIDDTKARALEMITLRKKRDSLLSESDIYVLPDRWNSYTEEKKAEWSAYRQALRDLPDTVTDVFNPVWPVMPSI
jgi:hypothetical protein